jgi:bacterioferritin-associated ferredoxin
VIVCHCKAVSDSSIREAVRDGARSFRQVARACDAGRKCGGCRPAIRELIDDETRGEVPATLLPLSSATV